MSLMPDPESGWPGNLPHGTQLSPIIIVLFTGRGSICLMSLRQAATAGPKTAFKISAVLQVQLKLFAFGDSGGCNCIRNLYPSRFLVRLERELAS